MDPLLRRAEAIVTQNTEKTETLKAFLASVFASMVSHQGSQAPETWDGKAERRKVYPLGRGFGTP